MTSQETVPPVAAANNLPAELEALCSLAVSVLTQHTSDGGGLPLLRVGVAV